MFARLDTQWHRGGMGGEATGLNYQSVESLFRIYNVKRPRRLLTELQILEQAALRKIRKDQETS